MDLQRRAALCAALSLVLCASAAGTPSRAAVLDPVIAALVAQVSATRLQADDTRLVGFGTRNLFSEVGQPKGRGVFAARDWLASQFADIAKTSDGRMTVAFDTYVLARTDRTPRDVTVSSVIVTLARRRSEARYDRHVEPLRFAQFRRQRRQTRRTRRRRQRLGRFGRARSGAHPGAYPLSRLPSSSRASTAKNKDCSAPITSPNRSRAAASWSRPTSTTTSSARPSATTGNRSPHDVRLFSEGLPDDATVRHVNALGVRKRLALTRTGALRQGDRADLRSRDERPPDLPLGSLPARRRPAILYGPGLPRRPLRRGSRKLRPPASDGARRKRHPVRRPAELRRFQVLSERDPSQRRCGRDPRARPAGAGRRHARAQPWLRDGAPVDACPASRPVRTGVASDGSAGVALRPGRR